MFKCGNKLQTGFKVLGPIYSYGMMIEIDRSVFVKSKKEREKLKDLKKKHKQSIK